MRRTSQKSMSGRAKEHILDILSDGKARPIPTILDDLWIRRESKERGMDATIPTTKEAEHFLNSLPNVEKTKKKITDIHDLYYGKKKMHYRLMPSDEEIEMIKKQQEHMIGEEEE